MLKGISFKIQPGESVAFVGATGAGKTSLISLHLALLRHAAGEVLIDGQDVERSGAGRSARHVGAVLQDPFIFSGTVASNIRLHEQEHQRRARPRGGALRQRGQVHRAAAGRLRRRRCRSAARASRSGQRQLLAFARAIAFNPEILLMLDEATSSVDTETEALIQDALEKLMRGRTSIIIAHRLSTIRNVDRIIVLHKGRIVEEGTHESCWRATATTTGSTSCNTSSRWRNVRRRGSAGGGVRLVLFFQNTRDSHEGWRLKQF